MPDDVDNCPSIPNPSQSDKNGNGIGDPCDVVGGEILGIDMTSLFVAGAFANASWIVPIAGVTAAGIVGFALRRRIR